MWKLPFLIALVSLVFAVFGVVIVQFILLNLGVPEMITNLLALLVGLGGIVLAELLVRRWWAKRHPPEVEVEDEG